MHIGIDCRLPYYQMGGISQYVIHLIRALSCIKNEYKYTLFTSRKDHRSYLPAEDGRFRQTTLWTPCHHPLERYTLSIELLPFRIDALLSPDFIPPHFGARRRIITVHDLNFVYYPEFLTAESRRYYLGNIAWALGSADHVLADSRSTEDDLVRQYGIDRSRITAVYLAAGEIFTRHHPAERIDQTLQKYEIESGYLLFVGTISPRKNVELLLHVYRHLLDEGAIDTSLVLVGSRGWLTEEFDNSVKDLKLGSLVRHLTDVSDEELAHLYHRATLLALPSYYEGFGLPVLEAMHCGCPVVVSNRGSLPEVAGPAGILVDPDDSEGWIQGIKNVYGDRKLRLSMIEEGYKQAAKFSWEQTALMTLSALTGQLE